MLFVRNNLPTYIKSTAGMDNKKLLKFLFKDIAEIEELFLEKGSEGFDEFEIEFIQSRFKGARQLIQILSEKENKQVKKIRPRPVPEDVQSEVPEKKDDNSSMENTGGEMTTDEKESLDSLAQFEEELKEEKREAEETKETPEEQIAHEVKEKVKVESSLEQKIETEVQEVRKMAPIEKVEQKDKVKKEVVSTDATAESKVEPDKNKSDENANNRLGDSFAKEKSINELLGKKDSSKLEYKISNSPVESIKASIGINDRYQYIRELFEGSADGFSKAVAELDNLNSIEEAVSYLQENYKWKKNETSLKFVNLVKRRFANGE